MIETTIKIENATGLHARPAAAVVNAAKGFACGLTVTKGAKTVNLKSLISLLSLGICQGEEIALKADGEDEAAAIDAVVKVIGSLEE